MKSTLHFFLFFFTSIVFSQETQFAGEYGYRSETKDSTVIEYTLSLKPDGTFTFHFYRNIDPSQPKENSYGKGTWKADKKRVLFLVDKETDIDEKYTLDFTNTKARFIKKVPRGESGNKKETLFLFYDSEIPWVKGLKLRVK